ncbi:endonuclease domain-containing protein [Geodermatophilus sp. FMUSA9-8]|uniref:endonuclease domain-containing protein n=1 Tax=Geodermatophilus sp. FMUSA9-8 TaxID=3120155 RepID=UPI00300B6D56
MEPLDLGSSWTWRDARARGATRRQIASGGEELTRGLYLSRADLDSLVARCRAWTRLLPPDAAFGLETAAALYGAHTDPPPEVQVVVRPRPVLPQRRGLVVAVRDLRAPDVVEAGGLRITSGAQTFLDLATGLRPAELVAVGDALLRAGRLTPAALAERLERADRVRGVRQARRCAVLLDGRAMSRPESLVRYWLATSDLPAPEVQLPICDRRGRVVAHADLGWPRYRLAVEYEGRQHADADRFGRDVDRYSLMAADGWLVLRFAARHLAGPAVVVERSRGALLSRGWRPGAPAR